MSRILFAWEIGDGMGHITRMLVVASRLRELGHDCIFVFSDIELAGARVQTAGFDVLPAPKIRFWLENSVRKLPRSHGDILAKIGYSEETRLRPYLTAWKSIIKRIAPDMVVLDYAPTARLAVGDRIPTIVIGDGFTLPPAVDGRFPFFRDMPKIVDKKDILQTIAKIQTGPNDWCPASLPDLLTGSRNFLIILPQLDFYAEQRDYSAIGPLIAPPLIVEDVPSQICFGYLDAKHKATIEFMDRFKNSDLTGAFFLINIDPSQKIRLRRDGLKIFDYPQDWPQDMRELAKKAAVLIHHGGMGMSEVCLGLGRPQIILPTRLERTMNALNLKRTGTSLVLKNWRSIPPEVLLKTVSAAADDETLKKWAGHVARGLSIDRISSLSYIVAECQKLLKQH